MSVASSIIAGFTGSGAETYAVRRRAAPALTNGVAAVAAETTVPVLAAILPAKATDLARTTEGERLRDLVVIYAADPLIPGTEEGGLGDLVDFAGATYEVEDVDAFPGGLYVATARKKVRS